MPRKTQYLYVGLHRQYLIHEISARLHVERVIDQQQANIFSVDCGTLERGFSGACRQNVITRTAQNTLHDCKKFQFVLDHEYFQRATVSFSLNGSTREVREAQKQHERSVVHSRVFHETAIANASAWEPDSLGLPFTYSLTTVSAFTFLFLPGRKWCMAELTNLSDLQAAANRNRIDFLQTDLELCFTFVDLANTERQIGERDAASRLLEKAETGYANIARFLPDVENRDQKSEIEQKLAQLRVRLDTEQDWLNASALRKG
jgi:hypothetical protein